MIYIIQIIATVHTKKKRLGYDSILLTIKRITQISQRVITASTYQLELCFSLFFQYLTENHNSSLKFSETECSVNCESPVLLLPFWELRHAQNNRNRRICAVENDVPRVFPAFPRWPKSLKTLGTRLELKTNGFDVIGVYVFVPPTP